MASRHPRAEPDQSLVTALEGDGSGQRARRTEVECKDCGKEIPRRSGPGKQRERCYACRKKRHDLLEREAARRRKPNWEAGKARKAELQREYLARSRAAREN